MIDTKFYEDKLNKSTESKEEINDNLNPIIRDYAKMHKLIFGERVFKFIRDLDYFRDSENENEISKLDKLIKNFAKTYEFFQKMGKENEIEEKLRNYGIKISFEQLPPNLEVADSEEYDKFIKIWNMHFSEVPNTINEVHTKLHKASFPILTDILIKKEEIIADALDVEENCKIKKSHYSKAVNLNYKERKSKPIEKELNNIKETAISLQDSITIF